MAFLPCISIFYLSHHHSFTIKPILSLSYISNILPNKSLHIPPSKVNIYFINKSNIHKKWIDNSLFYAQFAITKY